jgi:hypothetical protein
MSAFHVDARIVLKLDIDLAVRLGEIILDSHPNDAQLKALGHNLVNLDEDKGRQDWNSEKWRKEPVASEWKPPMSSAGMTSMHDAVALIKNSGLLSKAAKARSVSMGDSASGGAQEDRTLTKTVKTGKIRWGQ